MAQPFGVGDVVGGRYRITHHVVTSADQDIVFQGLDEVLDRDVNILLASKANAKQVATSARELASGERNSDVQLLDLGLVEERTYLISSLVNPNQLLDLVVPDAAPYVEPYFTDSLGSELFGQSRVMEPETYDDDAEYYARLQAGLSAEDAGETPAARFKKRRPAFLDKVGLVRREDEELPENYTEDELVDEVAQAAEDWGLQDASVTSLPASPHTAGGTHGSARLSLHSDLDVVDADASADTDETIDAVAHWEPRESASSDPLIPPPPAPAAQARPAAVVETETSASSDLEASETQDDSEPEASGPFVERDPSEAMSTVAYSAAGRSHGDVDVDERVAEGEEVIDNPPEGPDNSYDPQPSAHPSTRAVETVPAPPASSPAQHSLGAAEEASTFTGLISAVAPHRRSAFPHSPQEEEQNQTPEAPRRAAGPVPVPRAPAPAHTQPQAEDGAPRERGGPAITPGRLIAAGVLALVLVIAAVLVFMSLRGGEDPASEDPVEENVPADPQEDPAEDPAPEEEPEAQETNEAQGVEPASPTTTPDPVITGISRAQDAPEHNAEADGQLANLIDGNPATVWSTYSYNSPNFGGFVPSMALVAELEEPAPVESVTLNLPDAVTGGAFEILINDEPALEGAQSIGSGSFDGTEVSVSVDGGDEAQYVILHLTEMPQEVAPTVGGMPYRLQLAEFMVD
ncbi:hypothetical protein [Nesterenkonia flava]|uniref:ABC transporter substrate-binding protein n=1 Tax=Nesterenkonia flava TaxID=469799 RepID=A0ABU1FU64_9MICC|nr:hypothetical protein [Nesterenkonia flava]MDR5711787.1 hypothetical protein [Nesterenkonia flava]